MLKRIGQTAAVVALLMAIAVGASAAVSKDAAAGRTADPVGRAPTAEAVGGGALAAEATGHPEAGLSEVDAFCGPFEASDEELAEIGAETDALVEFLRELGYDVTVETDEYGIPYPVFDDDAEGIFEALDEFYMAQFSEEMASWSDAEKAEWNADVDALVAELAAEGIIVETEEIAPGVYDVVWTDEIDAFFGPIGLTDEFNAVFSGQIDLTGEFNVVLSGPIDLTGEFNAVFSGPIDLTGEFDAVFSGQIDLTGEDLADGLGDPFCGPFELSDEELAEINAETDALVEYLRELGYDVTVETDEYGALYPVFDEDADGIFEAIDEFFMARFGEEVAFFDAVEEAELSHPY